VPTIKLAIGIVASGVKKTLAQRHLRLFVLGTHRANRRKSSRQFKYKHHPAEEQNEKGEKLAQEEGRNNPEEHGFSNRHVSTTIIPPLTATAAEAIFRQIEPDLRLFVFKCHPAAPPPRTVLAGDFEIHSRHVEDFRGDTLPALSLMVLHHRPEPA